MSKAESQQTDTSDQPRKKRKERSKAQIIWRRITYPVIIVLFVVIFIMTLFAHRVFITIPPGHVGVLFSRFNGGTLTDPKDLLQEGMVVVNPVNRVYIYETRLQEQRETVAVLCQNGLTVHVSLSFWFRPDPDSVGLLHKEVGPEYIEKVIHPAVITALRTIVGSSSPEQVYALETHEHMEKILAYVKTALTPYHIDALRALVRTVELPPILNTSIERKLRQDQEAQEYEFRLVKEEKEMQRKKIEAQGIAAFHQTVQQDLTPEVLQLRGILATLALAQSDNAKVVIIGNPQGLGLPLVLGNLDNNSAGAHTQPKESGTAVDGSIRGSLSDLMPTAVDSTVRPQDPQANPRKEIPHTNELSPTPNELAVPGKDTQPSLSTANHQKDTGSRASAPVGTRPPAQPSPAVTRVLPKALHERIEKQQTVPDNPDPAIPVGSKSRPKVKEST